MQKVPYARARSRLKQVFDHVGSIGEPVAITRRSSRSVVLMSLPTYCGLVETLHLFHSREPENKTPAGRQDRAGVFVRPE
jgi:prevent-host-death family protein